MKRFIAIGLCALVLAACGDDGTAADPSSTTITTTPTTTTSTSTTVPESTSTTGAIPSFTVMELIEERPDGEVMVSGSLFNGGGGWSLCSALAESFPPQCGGFSLVIPNFDPTSYEIVAEAGIQWSDIPATITGTFTDDRLLLSEVPFELTDADRAIADAFQAFAAGGTSDDLPVGDTLQIGLADEIIATLTPDEFEDRLAWELEKEAFRAWVGPFSALELLADDRPIDYLLGPHNHCASPPVPAPDGLADLRRVSVFPTDATSCLEWWTVDFFVTADGTVAAVTMDLWEP
jgi:hypothetical protein